MTVLGNEKQVKDLLYPELSYAILGILFEVHNTLGTKYQEKHYQNAVATKLKQLNIPYRKEEKVTVNFSGEKLGDFFVDFIIDNKIILELKKVWRITHDDVSQVLRYLEATKMKLAIIANFRHAKLESRRVVLSRNH